MRFGPKPNNRTGLRGVRRRKFLLTKKRQTVQRKNSGKSFRVHYL